MPKLYGLPYEDAEKQLIDYRTSLFSKGWFDFNCLTFMDYLDNPAANASAAVVNAAMLR